MTKIEKILNGKSGDTVNIIPDYYAINDGEGYKAAYKVYESDSIKYPEKALIVIDHDVPAGNSESSVIFEKLVKFSKKFDIKFIQAKGITYSILSNKFVKSQNIIASCGSHNSIYGAKGALGLQVGEDELSSILTNGNFEFKIPETVLVELDGKLKDESPIDLFINFLSEFGNEIFTNKVIEFTGDGLNELSKEALTVLCSMATRTGAITALVNTDPVGDYSKKEKFDLGQVKSAIAMPVESKDSDFVSKDANDLKGQEFNAGFIGGYTGGNIEDLRHAASLMKEKHIAFGFRLNICPATSDVYLQALNEGLIDTFIDFGAQIIATSDRNVTLQGAGVVGSKEKIITTGSYNFSGCLGSDDAKVYIGSVDNVVRMSLDKKL
ncbi:aconitase family protein [Companilactobacillus insicii]|uniref:aconitase family protein n=1 Tax=Companilactobacillus insicii TaxID=1732567 RepID=UPI000F77B97E|nr:aconitase family protein [Companilactobacillus insicii]